MSRENKLCGKNRIEIGSLVYRKVHRLNSANDEEIAKLFNFFQVPYIVQSLNKNTATVQQPDDKIIRNENLDNLKVFKCSSEK